MIYHNSDDFCVLCLTCRGGLIVFTDYNKFCGYWLKLYFSQSKMNSSGMYESCYTKAGLTWELVIIGSWSHSSNLGFRTLQSSSNFVETLDWKLQIFHVMSSQPEYLTFCRVYKFLLSFPNVQIQVYLQVDNIWINIEEDIMWKLFWMWCHVQEWLPGEH